MSTHSTPVNGSPVKYPRTLHAVQLVRQAQPGEREAVIRAIDAEIERVRAEREAYERPRWSLRRLRDRVRYDWFLRAFTFLLWWWLMVVVVFWLMGGEL